jgi:hypothetical protein
MSWFQRKRKSKVHQPWRYRLTFEVLEDRWVPSTLGTPALLTTQQVSASFVQTGRLAGTDLVQHSDDSLQRSPGTVAVSSPTQSFVVDASTDDFSQPKIGVAGTPSQGEVEDIGTGISGNPPEHEDLATSISVRTIQHSARGGELTGGSQHPEATSHPQGTNAPVSGVDVGIVTIGGSPSEVAENSESSAGERNAIPTNGGSSSTSSRTASVSEGNGEESTKETASPATPSGSPALVTRQLDVNQRQGDYPPGPNGQGNDSHLLSSGKPMSVQLAGLQRGDGFLAETPRLSPEGAEGRIGVEATYLPQSSEFIEEIPFDSTALEAAWQNLLANLESCVNDLVHLSAQTGLAPFVLAAVMAVAALELARRRLYQADGALELFEAADGKASGLKHFSTGPRHE